MSRDAAPDIDGWIAQAKQLQADIERSRATAHDIVQQAEAGRTLHANVEDASSKVTLLKNELAFNDTLTATVERIKQASDLLDKAQDAAVEHDIIEALNKMKQADDYIIHLGPFRDTRVAGVLHKRVSQLREALAENTMGAWNLLLVVDVPNKRVSINQNIDGNFCANKWLCRSDQWHRYQPLDRGGRSLSARHSPRRHSEVPKRLRTSHPPSPLSRDGLAQWNQSRNH